MTRNTATSPTNNDTLGGQLINETQGLVLALYPWPFLEKQTSITSAASTATYELPVACKNNQIMSVNFQESSSVIYVVKPVYSAHFWEYLQALNTAASDVPLYYYIKDEQISFYPTISSASKTIQVRYRKIVKDMTQADYTTGTITTATNADETIVGGSTSWTAGMAGNHLRITAAAGASKGDGLWYEISSITDTTNLELVKKYAGTSLSAASAAYTIGEMPAIPGPFHNLLMYRPLAIYYMQNMEELRRADRFWRVYDGGYEAGLSPRVGGLLKQMMNAYSGTTEGVYIPEADDVEPTPGLVNLGDLQNFTGESW